MKHLCIIIKIMIVILLTSFTTSSYAQMGISSRAFVEILGIKTGYGTEGWFFEFEPEIATKLGVFGFSTTFERKTSSQRRVSSKEKIIYAPEKDFILTIKKDGKDHIYAIHGYEEIGFTTTGKSTFIVGKHSLFIDLTHANIHGLKLKGKKYSESDFSGLIKNSNPLHEITYTIDGYKTVCQLDENSYQQGTETKYYPDGKTIAYIKNYKDDQLHGESISYRKDGTISSSGKYQNGKGKCIYYRENGNIDFITNDEGDFKKYTTYYKNGNPDYIFYKDKNDLTQGKATKYYEEGGIEYTSIWKDGKSLNKTTQYRKNGDVW